jgi:hypothetical protein
VTPLSILAKYLHVPEGDAGGWVTYRPSLVRALLWTSERLGFGSTDDLQILELGTGVGSSPMFSALAASCDWINVLGVEHDPKWYAEATPLEHARYLVRMDPPDLQTTPFDVVFVDHGPVEARARDLALLANNPNVALVVVHDWNCDVYGYPAILPLWKHRVDDTGRWPNTGILSNTVDLSSWLGYYRAPVLVRELDDAGAPESHGERRS